MATKVIIEWPKVTAFLQTNPGCQAGVAAGASAVKASVEELAPVGKSLSWPGRKPMRHGLFKKSIEMRKYRHYYQVYSTDAFSRMIEFGTVNNPAYAPFRRTLHRFGGMEKSGGSDDS